MFLELTAMMDCMQTPCDFTISKKLIDYYFKIAKNILEFHNVAEEDVDKYYCKLNDIFDQPFININDDKDSNTTIYPKTEDYKSFGSGIIISNNGFIVTCNHVVEKGKSIDVEVYTGNKKELLVADVILKDKDNDLALLKIRDLELLNFKQIPFSISPSTMKVGEGAFALGFPLINTMGYELKVTNGIISAKTGFQNSINQYTISVPLQPGNSGGPLFDYNGNLTGIISAKHSGTDNVSYSIKINYLLSLLDLLSEPIKSQVTNSLPLNDLPKLVETLREYVVLIKVK
jgi:S1-C subfamily serine protease